MLPLAIEASWKMQKWDSLELFIQRLETSSSSTLKHIVHDGSPPEQPFQVSVGKLLLHLKTMDTKRFESDLREARLQVMF